MAETDPRLAVLARALAARLELDRSLGVEHAAFPRLPADQILPPRARDAAPDPWTAGGSAAASTALAVAEAPARPAGIAASRNESAVAERPAEFLAAPPRPSPPRASSFLTIPAPPPATGPKADALAPTREQALVCRLCGLAESRHSVVFGEGSLDTDLVFVGEAPGRDEDEQGRPFVGRAGKLLTAMIENGLERPRASVYICNILKCRPPGNRDPRPDEVVSCLPYLHRQLEIIRPRVIVALGRIAANLLAEQNASMGKLRGRWFTYRGIPLTAIYHPAYLLRQREACGGKSPADRETWEDLKAVRKRLAES